MPTEQPPDPFSPASDASDTLPTPQLDPAHARPADPVVLVMGESSPAFARAGPGAGAGTGSDRGSSSKNDVFMADARGNGYGYSYGHAQAPLAEAARALNIPSTEREREHHRPRTEQDPKRALGTGAPRAQLQLQRPPPILVRRPTDLGRTVEAVAAPGSASPTRPSFLPAPSVDIPATGGPMTMQGGLNITLSPASTTEIRPPELLSPYPILSQPSGEEADRLPDLMPTPSPRRTGFRQPLGSIPEPAASPLSPAWQSWQTASPSSPSHPGGSGSMTVGSPRPRQTSGERREGLGVPPSPLGPGGSGRRTSLPAAQPQLPSSPFAPPRAWGRPGDHAHGRSGSIDPTPQHGIHARNLSLFFPQPGAGQPLFTPGTPTQPHTQYAPVSPQPQSDILIHAASPQLARHPFNGAGGWTFGAPISSEGLGLGTPEQDQVPRSKRRGHHHKHSLSHNFFSFLDPTVTNPALSASPSPGPTPQIHGSDILSNAPTPGLSSISTSAGALSPLPPPPFKSGETVLSSFAVLQFLTGAALWVEGQIGGWRCLAGVGYLVVFDAIGVGIKGMERRAEGWRGIRRPYGLPRVLALLHFTQSIFLLFAAVYIAKESIEQVLLGSGAHAHTHSHGHALEPAVPHALSEGPEQARGFPHFLLGLAATMSLCAGVGLGNHQKLVDAVGPLFLPARMARIGGALGLRVMGNPFSLAVTGGSMAVLAGSLASLHALDSFLSLLLTLLALALSLPPARTFGHVLLQTAPAASSGQMQAIRAALRDIQDDRRVVGLGAVRCWMVDAGHEGAGTDAGAGGADGEGERARGTPRGSMGSLSGLDTPDGSPRGSFSGPTGGLGGGSGGGVGGAPLVVTLTVHVAEDLSDREVLEVTREVGDKLRGISGVGWRGVGAGARWGKKEDGVLGLGMGMGMGRVMGEGEQGGQGEVTVAVKRGREGLEVT